MTHGRSTPRSHERTAVVRKVVSGGNPQNQSKKMAIVPSLDTRAERLRRLGVVDLREAAKERKDQELVAAILERHPNAKRGLDRLLNDIALLPTEEEQARYDMKIDNDWDGMA